MTDRFGALAVAVGSWTTDAEALLADFRKRYAGDPLVFDKWLGLSAAPAQDDTIERVRAILAEPDFPKNNPNRLRALVSETPLADHDFREAQRHADAWARRRAEVAESIRRLEARQDELLDRLSAP